MADEQQPDTAEHTASDDKPHRQVLTPAQEAEATALVQRSAQGNSTDADDVPEYKRGHGTVTSRARDRQATQAEAS